MNLPKIKTSLKFDIITIVVVSVFLFDFITKFCIVYNIEGFRRYSALPKILIEIGAFVFILKNGVKDKTVIVYILILCFVFGLNTCLPGFFEPVTDNLVIKLYNLNKYLYLSFFVVAFLSFEAKKRSEIIIQIRNTVVVIGVINGLFMLFGYFAHYEILRSYSFTKRFGLNGFILKTSEASYLYILLIITTYYDYLKNKTKGFILLYFILISFLIGTKAIWLFVALLILIHFLYHNKNSVRIVSYVVLSISSLVGVLFNKLIVKLVVNLFSFGPDLYEKYNFLTVLTSTRNLLFLNTLNYIKEHGTVVNLFFGGVELKEFGVEFELIDLLLFFGIIGFAVYILLIKRIFFSDFFSKYKLLLFFALMCVTLFGGNFFMSITCSVFAFVVFKYMDYLIKTNG